jgi:ABC-type phosphate transport system substrate-binding protein
MMTKPLNEFNGVARRLLAGALICLPLLAHAGIAVVVGANSPAAKLSVEQVGQLFLAKTSALPGAGQAVLIDQAEGAAVRDAFYVHVTGKSATQVKALWSRLVFSGAAQLPQALGSGAEVKKAVGGNANAIGYIDAAEVDASVKVLLTIN